MTLEMKAAIRELSLEDETCLCIAGKVVQSKSAVTGYLRSLRFARVHKKLGRKSKLTSRLKHNVILDAKRG